MENEHHHQEAQATVGAVLLIVAGLAVGFTGIFLDAIWGIKSVFLLASGIFLGLLGLAVPLIASASGPVAASAPRKPAAQTLWDVGPVSTEQSTQQVNDELRKGW